MPVFCDSCGHHPDFHSFPTRRSSDLTAVRFIPRPVTIGFTNGIAVLIASTQIRNSVGEPDRRSEEHTSELQSHSDLVCRLLLEKKKCTPKIRHGTGPWLSLSLSGRCF